MTSALQQAADDGAEWDGLGQPAGAGRRRDGSPTARQHLRGRRRQARARPGRRHDHRHACSPSFRRPRRSPARPCCSCVEEGKLDLDAPAKTYAPDIGKLQVLDGFDAAGKPKLRAPKRDITTRMLLLHTAGFGYDFFNEHYNRLAQEHGQPSVITASKAAIMTPLLFDPGEHWEYGSNIDWCGQVVEGIRGKRLGEVMRERIFAPLGMDGHRLHA